MSQERNESDDRSSSRSPCRDEYIVKLRGIPQSATRDEVKKFLSPCQVVTVHLFDNNGSSASDCFVELEAEVDLKDALKKSGQTLDKKYIEIFRASSYELNFHIKHKGTVSWPEPVIRVNGLPFDCTMADVQNFFESAEIAKNGIYITRDMEDKALGDGFVAFVNMDNAYKAFEIHNHKQLQDRCIELFPSSYDEAKQKIMNDARSNVRQFVGEDQEQEDNKPNINNNNVKQNYKSKSRSRSRSKQRSRSRSHGYRQRDTKRRRSPSASPPSKSHAASSKSGNHRSSNNSRRRSRSRSELRHSSSRNEVHLVKIRGMPYTVVEDDIRKFFPETCQPSRIEILQDRRMKRPNGDAYLYYKTLEEVDEALKYDRKYMGSRYVEIYFDSPRYSSLTNRRKKPENISRRSSRSPSRSKYNRHSRSRSDSMN